MNRENDFVLRHNCRRNSKGYILEIGVEIVTMVDIDYDYINLYLNKDHY